MQATRQAAENHGDQAEAGESDATAKAAGKKAGLDADSPKLDGGTPNGLLPVAAAENESRADATRGTGKSGGSSPHGAATSDETVAPDASTRPAGPMKDISVRVESAQGQNVDVRIVQRAGDLRIAVQSADNDTTQGLRHGLSELSTRLNESGYHAETWRPGHLASAPESAAESGNSSHQPPSGDAQSNSGWSQQNRGQRDNNPSNRPRWIQELESNLAGGTASTGQFHGLIG